MIGTAFYICPILTGFRFLQIQPKLLMAISVISIIYIIKVRDIVKALSICIISLLIIGTSCKKDNSDNEHLWAACSVYRADNGVFTSPVDIIEIK